MLIFSLEVSPKGFEKTQFYTTKKKLRYGDLVLKQTFQLDQPQLCHKAATKRYLHGTSNLFPRFPPTIPHDDRPPCLNAETSLDSVRLHLSCILI